MGRGAYRCTPQVVGSGWAGVGNANPHSAISWANLLIEYGPWLEPATARAVEHLPGHNSSYKRNVLLEYGPALETMLETESILHWDLRAKGFALLLEPAAKALHLNFTTIGASMRLRFHSGRLFAAARAAAGRARGGLPMPQPRRSFRWCACGASLLRRGGGAPRRCPSMHFPHSRFCLSVMLSEKWRDTYWVRGRRCSAPANLNSTWTVRQPRQRNAKVPNHEFRWPCRIQGGDCAALVALEHAAVGHSPAMSVIITTPDSSTLFATGPGSALADGARCA